MIPPRAWLMLVLGVASSVTGLNPYQGNRFLVRIHRVSVLLVVPQFTLSRFGLVWLVTAMQFSTLAAGFVVGAAQFTAAGYPLAFAVVAACPAAAVPLVPTLEIDRL